MTRGSTSQPAVVNQREREPLSGDSACLSRSAPRLPRRATRAWSAMPGRCEKPIRRAEYPPVPDTVKLGDPIGHPDGLHLDLPLSKTDRVRQVLARPDLEAL